MQTIEEKTELKENTVGTKFCDADMLQRLQKALADVFKKSEKKKSPRQVQELISRYEGQEDRMYRRACDKNRVISDQTLKKDLANWCDKRRKLVKKLKIRTNRERRDMLVGLTRLCGHILREHCDDYIQEIESLGGFKKWIKIETHYHLLCDKYGVDPVERSEYTKTPKPRCFKKAIRKELATMYNLKKDMPRLRQLDKNLENYNNYEDAFYFNECMRMKLEPKAMSEFPPMFSRHCKVCKRDLEAHKCGLIQHSSYNCVACKDCMTKRVVQCTQKLEQRQPTGLRLTCPCCNANAKDPVPEDVWSEICSPELVKTFVKLGENIKKEVYDKALTQITASLDLVKKHVAEDTLSVDMMTNAKKETRTSINEMCRWYKTATGQYKQLSSMQKEINDICAKFFVQCRVCRNWKDIEQDCVYLHEWDEEEEKGERPQCRVCKACVHNHLKANLKTGRFTCLLNARCKHGHLTPSIMRKCVDDHKELTEIINAHAKFMLKRTVDARQCSNCEYMFIVDTSDECRELQCSRCDHAFCRDCNLGAHGKMSCEEFFKKNLQNEWADILGPEGIKTAAENRKKCKLCPGCNVLIEKNQGCDHMTCKYCWWEFCWGCRGDYPSGCTCGKFTRVPNYVPTDRTFKTLFPFCKVVEGLDPEKMELDPQLQAKLEVPTMAKNSSITSEPDTTNA